MTEDDVLDEIVLILRDAVGELGDGRTHPIAAMQRAQVNSSQRAIARCGIEPTESTAQAIAWWLVDRARLRSEQDAFAVALAASERTDAADPLTRELIGFVRGTVNREISLEDFWVRIRRAQREAERTREGAVFKLTPAPDAIDVADAEQVLRTMLGEAGVDLARPDIRRIWNVFVAFARRPVKATPPFEVAEVEAMEVFAVVQAESVAGVEIYQEPV